MFIIEVNDINVKFIVFNFINFNFKQNIKEVVNNEVVIIRII